MFSVIKLTGICYARKLKIFSVLYSSVIFLLVIAYESIINFFIAKSFTKQKQQFLNMLQNISNKIQLLRKTLF